MKYLIEPLTDDEKEMAHNLGILMPSNIYEAATRYLPAEDLDHHYSDLYIKVSHKSTLLMQHFQYSHLVYMFVDSDGAQWFDLPFCYTPYWERKDRES